MMCAVKSLVVAMVLDWPVAHGFVLNKLQKD